jgi:serine/threonine protein phosphatase PrpC
MQFSVYQESHIGGRKVNQDRMGYSYTRDALLLVLADGMGGHLRGEAAATIALQTISALFQQQATPLCEERARALPGGGLHGGAPRDPPLPRPTICRKRRAPPSWPA